jgi:hypothetical protein
VDIAKKLSLQLGDYDFLTIFAPRNLKPYEKNVSAFKKKAQEQTRFP